MPGRVLEYRQKFRYGRRLSTEKYSVGVNLTRPFHPANQMQVVGDPGPSRYKSSSAHPSNSKPELPGTRREERGTHSVEGISSSHKDGPPGLVRQLPAKERTSRLSPIFRLLATDYWLLATAFLRSGS
jgi:hypothetical protein